MQTIHMVIANPAFMQPLCMMACNGYRDPMIMLLLNRPEKYRLVIISWIRL